MILDGIKYDVENVGPVTVVGILAPFSVNVTFLPEAKLLPLIAIVLPACPDVIPDVMEGLIVNICVALGDSVMP